MNGSNDTKKTTTTKEKIQKLKYPIHRMQFGHYEMIKPIKTNTTLSKIRADKPMHKNQLKTNNKTQNKQQIQQLLTAISKQGEYFFKPTPKRFQDIDIYIYIYMYIYRYI